MENSKKTVVGVFDNRGDAAKEIQRLQGLGYTQSEINVYSNPDRARTIQDLQGVHVEDIDVPENNQNEEDSSWWETTKNAFNFFVFDPDQGDQRIRAVDNADRSNLTPEFGEEISGVTDILDSYTEDLANGKLIIVVDNYREDGVR